MNHERAPRQAAADVDRAAGIVAKMSVADKIALACARFRRRGSPRVAAAEFYRRG